MFVIVSSGFPIIRRQGDRASLPVQNKQNKLERNNLISVLLTVPLGMRRT